MSCKAYGFSTFGFFVALTTAAIAQTVANPAQPDMNISHPVPRLAPSSGAYGDGSGMGGGTGGGAATSDGSGMHQSNPSIDGMSAAPGSVGSTNGIVDVGPGAGAGAPTARP